jgi:hypothetical protein
MSNRAAVEPALAKKKYPVYDACPLALGEPD